MVIEKILKDSLLKDVHRYADRFLLATRKHEPPGIIGAVSADPHHLGPHIKI